MQALHLFANRGKAAALNAGLAAESWGEVVAVYDADHRPEPGSLRALAAVLSQPGAAAASARTAARNALALPAPITALWNAWYTSRSPWSPKTGCIWRRPSWARIAPMTAPS